MWLFLFLVYLVVLGVLMMVVGLMIHATTTKPPETRQIEPGREFGEVHIGNYRREGFELLPWRTKRLGDSLYYEAGRNPGWYYEVFIQSAERKNPTAPLEANKRRIRGISPS